MDASHYLQFAVMIRYFQLVPEQQRDVLAETQNQLGLPALFLEKDYWVCRVLDMLFGNKALNPHLCFRGGTFLSKAFHCIQRFSEDIDNPPFRQLNQFHSN